MSFKLAVPEWDDGDIGTSFAVSPAKPLGPVHRQRARDSGDDADPDQPAKKKSKKKKQQSRKGKTPQVHLQESSSPSGDKQTVQPVDVVDVSQTEGGPAVEGSCHEPSQRKRIKLSRSARRNAELAAAKSGMIDDAKTTATVENDDTARQPLGKTKLSNSAVSESLSKLQLSKDAKASSVEPSTKKKKKKKKKSTATTTSSESGSGSMVKQPHGQKSMVQQGNNKFTSSAEKRLAGARFRMLNEKLYTTSGDQAYDMFQNNPELFKVYHEGFQSQVTKWPENPVDLAIQWLRKRPPSLVVADFGCGVAEVAQSVQNKVHSFDLVAHNEHVVACDISNVPLNDRTVDVALFSLALMGTNFLDYITEAHRVLRKKGHLRIYEVVSRIPALDDFNAAIEAVGFEFVSQGAPNVMFIELDFVKSSNITGTPTPEMANTLQPCIYKRR